MSRRHQLQRSIYQLLRHNRDGSFATQANRSQILKLFARDLIAKGYKVGDIQSLRTNHITSVVDHWKKQGLTNASLKNRTSILRYLAEKLGKPNIVPSNDKLGIGARIYVPQYNKALYNPDFSKITEPFVKISLELQRVFGLRREEALKIRPWAADQKTYLVLQPSWCKGGRSRQIPILTEEQRYWLDQAKAFVQHKNFSLIPPQRSYIQQRNLYDKQVQQAGLRRMHGLRHAYAQQRYKELTGFEAPINGGPSAKELTIEQKQQDFAARMTITEELGHSKTNHRQLLLTITY